jgi:uncharacterized protein YjbI with pentapeptide repeats
MMKKMSAKELLQRYADGERDFSWVDLSLKTFNKLGSVNLSGANLSHASLYLTDLSHADLSMVDLSWSWMDNTKLRGANLQGANLSNARLKNVKLMGANLSGGNLSRADLHMTIWGWEGANLCGANLLNATISDALSLRLVDKRGAIMPNGSCVPDTLNKAQLQPLAKEHPKELESIDQTVSTEIKDIAAAKEHLEAEDYFSPKSLKEAQEQIAISIARRQGQSKFRQSLLKAYNYRCAITGCDAQDALEAAHIIPYSETENNHLSNGLLLRADLHTLFDLDLIAINPETMKVHLAPSLRRTSYSKLEGESLKLPHNKAHCPRKEALQERCNQWQWYI